MSSSVICCCLSGDMYLSFSISIGMSIAALSVSAGVVDLLVSSRAFFKVALIILFNPVYIPLYFQQNRPFLNQFLLILLSKFLPVCLAKDGNS